MPNNINIWNAGGCGKWGGGGEFSNGTGDVRL
jgi:hypothetical protein